MTNKAKHTWFFFITTVCVLGGRQNLTLCSTEKNVWNDIFMLDNFNFQAEINIIHTHHVQIDRSQKGIKYRDQIHNWEKYIFSVCVWRKFFFSALIVAPNRAEHLFWNLLELNRWKLYCFCSLKHMLICQL